MKILLGHFLIIFLLLTVPFSSFAREEKILGHDGLKRTYLIEDFDPDSSAKKPLFIILHGGKGNAEYAWKTLNIAEIAKREKMILVAPNGVDHFWNDGRTRPIGREDPATADDVGYISKLIDKIIKDHNADPERVYLAGISNGGMMTLRLACEIPEKIAAFSSIIATLPTQIAAKCKDHPVSGLFIHGTEDPVVKFNGGYYRPSGKFIEGSNSAEATVNFFVKKAQCTSRSPVVRMEDIDKNDESTISKHVFYDCRNNTSYEWYIVEGGGHSPPNAKTGLLRKRILNMGAINNDMDPGEHIWAFFRNKTR